MERVPSSFLISFQIKIIFLKIHPQTAEIWHADTHTTNLLVIN